MAGRKKLVPMFATEEEEAAFREEHSPLEFYKESEFKPLETRAPKDRPITVRLDSHLKALLEEFASAHHMGPSTAVRAIVEQALARFDRARQKGATVEELMSSVWDKVPPQRREELEKLATDMSIGNPEDPVAVFATRGQMEAFSRLFFYYLLTALGAEIVHLGDGQFEALRARPHC